jgi:hypothetical protein
MKRAERNGETSGKAGCITLLLCCVSIEGGIVLAAWALHGLLGDDVDRDRILLPAAVAGVLLAFGGPLLFFRSLRVWPRVTWQQLVAAVPDLSLAGWFVITWAAPQLIGTEAAGVLPGLMVLEFIIIHASVVLVMAPRQMAAKMRDQRWWNTPRAMLVWLLLMYAICAAGISAAVKSIWLFVGFWALIGNKFIDDWLAPAAQAGEREHRQMARWVVSAVPCLFLGFGSIFIPVPRLGAMSASSGDGLWEQNPEQAAAMGALYFALLGFCELYGAFNRVNQPIKAAGS